MADPVTLAHWAGTDVKLGQVLETLAALHRQVARASARTSVMTLVVVAGNDDEEVEASRAMAALGGHHPARVVVVRTDPDAPEVGVDARLTVYGAEVDDHPLTFDEIVLTVRSAGCEHLDSMIEPFTLSDLPLVIWYPGSLPAVSDCLLPVADTVVVDSRETGELDTLAGLVELARRRTAVDLSWERLAPWRELLAGLFDPPECRPFVDRVSSVEIAGKPGPRQLLAGWIISRLGQHPPEAQLLDARHVAIRLHAGHDGHRATFQVVRNEGERVVRSTSIIDGREHQGEVMSLPDDSLAWSLSRALTHLRRDRAWEQAISAAVVLKG